MNNALTVNEIIDQRPLSRFQVSTMILCGLVLVLDGFDAQSIGFLASSMAKTLGTSVKTFGPVFSAALFGLMISAMIAGPIADRWGRKWPTIICTLTFGTFSFLTARATSFDELVLFRLLTGFGLGGAMPNIVALTSEYAPKRLMSDCCEHAVLRDAARSTSGRGIVSSVMLPRFGVAIGFLYRRNRPVRGCTDPTIKALPESVRFLTVRGADPDKIRSIMGRISPETWRICPSAP